MWMFKHCLQKENVISAASPKNHLERNTIKALLKKKLVVLPKYDQKF